MLLIAVIWILLVGYVLLRPRRVVDPPAWWTALAIGNVLASIAFGIISVFVPVCS